MEIFQYNGANIEVYHHGPGWRATVRIGGGFAESILTDRDPSEVGKKAVIAEAKIIIDNYRTLNG